MPATAVRNLIVFGDSLSDIGKKWLTKSGKAALQLHEMYVSPTGRYSDCRNWTDFMFEEATGLTMVVDSAEESVARSQKHTSLTSQSDLLLSHDQSSLSYANYAEGGACGDTPAALMKRPFLGTFKDQVDQFEKDVKSFALPKGHTLFIIWFGANDLYTASREASEMNLVAEQVAQTQRNRLKMLVPDSTFIFVDMARPLTSVRYSSRLQKAESELRAAQKKVNAEQNLTAMVPMEKKPGMWHARDALNSADFTGVKVKEVARLREQVAITQNLEKGVLLFNLTLAKTARFNGDRVVELGSVITEDTVRQIVEGNYSILAGAADTQAVHISSQASSGKMESSHMTTIDEVHPSDRVYKLIWNEIYEEIKKSGCVIGKLVAGLATPTLVGLAGPSQQTKSAFDQVMEVPPKTAFNFNKVMKELSSSTVLKN